MDLFKNAAGYVPLYVNLEGYWERSLAELPAELRELVKKKFPIFNWDETDVANRKRLMLQIDYQHDPNHEPSMYFELSVFQDELQGWIETARKESKDSAVVALRDVADRVEKILDTDRERVGIEIQKLRIEVEELRARASLVWKGLDPDSEFYAGELDIALQVWRAITKQRDPELTPKEQAMKWLEGAYPRLSREAKDRIATICNWDKTGGRKRISE